MEQSHATWSLAEDTPLVLVVDDNDDDLMLFRRAVQQLNYSGRIQYINGGAQAIAYLAGQGEFEDRTQFPQPDLLILDLNMPGIDGFDVLAWMQDQEITPTRTVVLTTSDDLQEITRAYALGADSFLSKAFSFTEFKETVGALLAYFDATTPRPPAANRPVAGVSGGWSRVSSNVPRFANSPARSATCP
jgi:CheY-like chemotaxis protein